MYTRIPLVKLDNDSSLYLRCVGRVSVRVRWARWLRRPLDLQEKLGQSFLLEFGAPTHHTWTATSKVYKNSAYIHLPGHITTLV